MYGAGLGLGLVRVWVLAGRRAGHRAEVSQRQQGEQAMVQ